MRKKLLLIITLFIPNIAMAASFSPDKYYKNVCGLENVVSENIPTFTSGLYNIIRILVPVILIIMGMIDMFSAVVASDEDKMKKAQQKLFTRLIAAILIFFIMSVVQFVFNQQSISDKESLTNCMDCLLSNKSCGTTGKGISLEKKKCQDYSYKECPTGEKTDDYGLACQKNKKTKKCQIKDCSSIKDNAAMCYKYSNVCTYRGICMQTPKVTISSKKKAASDSASANDSCKVSCSNIADQTAKNKCYETCRLSAATKCNGIGSATEKEKCLDGQRGALVNEALKYLGHPYAQVNPAKLCENWKNDSSCRVDCSSFVQILYKRYGYSLPRTSSQQSSINATVVPMGNNYANLKLADLVFYGGDDVHHVAIYMGNGEIVHASDYDVGVITSTIGYGEKPSKVLRIIE